MLIIRWSGSWVGDGGIAMGASKLALNDDSSGEGASDVSAGTATVLDGDVSGPAVAQFETRWGGGMVGGEVGASWVTSLASVEVLGDGVPLLRMFVAGSALATGTH